MKKSYLLLLVAGCLSSFSVNAQNKLSDPMSQRDARHPKTKKTIVLPVRQVMTRATAQALPDSVVWVEPTDGKKYWKEVYTYTKEGRLAKTEGMEWNSDMSKWEFYEDYTYTYTDQGLMSSYKTTNADGYVYERNIKYEGKKGFFTAKGSSPNLPTVEYKGEMTYNDQGLWLSETIYLTPDINGDGVINAGDYNTDGTPWYKGWEYAYEYDASGNCTKSTEIEFTADESIYSKEVTTTVWNGLSYSETVVTEYPGDKETYTEEYKYEVKDGNPREGLWYEKDEDTGEWILDDKDYTYFPKGGSTANEALETPAQEAEIAVAGGTIYVSTSASVPVQVYNILGVCHYNAVVNGSASVSGLSAGVYVVRAGKQVTKVSVR